ncbi:MAG: hypothetical protein WAN36_07455 [Calditrichia bacterium]
MKYLQPKWALEWKALIKKEGLKGFIKKKGWKFVIAFFLFYLIRDLTLYVILPYFAFSKISGCG